VDDFKQQLLLRNDELVRENRDLRLRHDELENENAALRAVAREGERATKEREGAFVKLRAAEDARAAAERVAEKEHYARLGAEEEVERLKGRIVALQEQPSRLAQLREELEV
jgi:hypothetical protein